MDRVHINKYLRDKSLASRREADKLNDGRLAREILSEKQKYEKEYVVIVKEHLRAGIPAIFESGMKMRILTEKFF